MKATKKSNIAFILLSIVLIIAVVCFAIISYAWYSVNVDDISSDLNVETNSVHTFEVLHASFFEPNDILRASVAYANNQYPDDVEAATGNVAKFKYATLDVDYKIYNAESAEDYVFTVTGLELYGPGIVSEYDEPLYKVEIGKNADGAVTVTKTPDGRVIDAVLSDLQFSFATEKDADNHAQWTGTDEASWGSITETTKTLNLSKDGTLYLAVAFNKYDDLLDEVIYSGIKIKVLVTMEKATAA